jgi:sugar phosphate isomerase/epimerase
LLVENNREAKKIHRRTLLKHLFGAFAGTVLLNDKSAACAPSAIGLQLYTVRKNLERDFEETLRRVSAAGIKEVEFAGYFNYPALQIKKLLKKSGLSAPSAHIDLETLRRRLPEAIEDARIIGHKYLVLGYLPEETRKSLDDYKALIELLNSAGRQCRQAGLQFAYHNHDFEFKKTEGRIPYDLILAETDSQTVKMELDLYWITKAGLDPIAYFEKDPGRFPLVHVKDMDDTPAKSFTEVGRGVIDFRKIFSKAGAAGIRHYFIEQDETPGEPLESVKTSLKYLRALKC